MQVFLSQYKHYLKKTSLFNSIIYIAIV